MHSHSDHSGCRASVAPGAGPVFGRRRFALGIAALVGTTLLGTRLLRAETAAPDTPATPQDYPQFRAMRAQVLPEDGIASRIAPRDSIVQLVQNRVISREKFEGLYSRRGGLPDEVGRLLDAASDQPLHITRQSAGYYVNLFWPLGLANHMAANAWSPVNGEDLFTFASTGGWGLGEAANGGAYFNDYPIVPLSPEQETRVLGLAKSIYRPCCGNSTFFQDCNHGSAMLGLMQLGVTQGLSDEELYREALSFNTYWFPDVYVRTGLYFQVARGTEWRDVDPRTVVSAEFSSGRNWRTNVLAKLEEIPDLLPSPESGANCGV